MSLRQNLRAPVSQALDMSTPIEVTVGASVGECISLMQQNVVGCIVVTENRALVGIFTERDILTKVLACNLPLSTTIDTVMTTQPKVIEEDTSVADMVSLMNEGGFRHMPVVDRARRLVGVLSAKSVVEFLVEHFPSTVLNLPPDPAHKQAAREGA